MYVDSNIFIYAAIDTDTLGKQCRAFIKDINDKKITVAASYLIIDEVIWVLKKHVGKANAIAITKAMLSLPVKWFEVDSTVMFSMIDMFEQTRLDPRDALHIATMKKSGLTTILSEDTDFDEIAGITRKNVKQYFSKKE